MQPRWYGGATRGQWLALAAALLGWAFDGFEMGVFPIIARPALIELEGLSEQEQIRKDESRSQSERDQAKAVVDKRGREGNAGLTAVFLTGGWLGGRQFGWIGDRIGRVRAMVFSVLAYAVFTGACGFAKASWHLAVLRFLAALGMGGEWSLGVALVMEKWSPHARPVLAGLIGVGSNLGFLSVAILSRFISPDKYWRVILVACVFPALLTFFIRMFVPESEKWEKASASGPKPGIGAIFVPGLRSRSLLGAGLGAVALLATWGAVQWLPLWVGQMTPRETDKVDAQICSALGAIVGAFLGAVWLQHLPRRLGYFALCLVSLVACQFLFAPGVFPETLGKREFGASFLVSVALVGACSAAFYGWLPLYLPELFPTRVRAAGQGFCYNFGRSLAAVGVLLVNFGIDLKGEYARAGAIVVLVYLVGMVLAWFAPETKCQLLPA